MPTIFLPAVLQGHTNNSTQVEVAAETLEELLETLIKKFPNLKKYFFNQDNELCNFLNIYLNGEDVRFLQGLKTPVAGQDKITVLLAVSGG
ncbi:MAG: MoaD/ThiS family protein [Gammaproteobacteria bacterium]|nr:MoaD/ThiS family protein [Gammaproteobacteria bacterium]